MRVPALNLVLPALHVVSAGLVAPVKVPSIQVTHSAVMTVALDRAPDPKLEPNPAGNLGHLIQDPGQDLDQGPIADQGQDLDHIGRDLDPFHTSDP